MLPNRVIGAPWERPDQAISLLDEHHLAAWDATPEVAARFGAWIASGLSRQPSSEVWTIDGENAGTLRGLVRQFARLIPGDMGISMSESVAGGRGWSMAEPKIDGPAGLTEMLRIRGGDAFRASARFRYVIWHDADASIQSDERLFLDVADALMGVAAEAEYAGERLLMIQRVLLIGGRRLQEMATGADAPLRRWRRDGAGVPFWSVVTGLKTPPLLAFPVARILNGQARVPDFVLV